MTSSALRKFAEPLGFENKNGRLFGDYQGYSVTLIDGMGFKSMMIGVTLTKEDPRVNIIIGFIETNRKESQIQDYGIHPSNIRINLIDKLGTMKRFTELLDKTVAMLRENNVPGNSTCWYCENEFAGAKPEKIQVNEAVVPMHASCVEHYSASLQQASEEFKSQPKNYLQGSLGALLGGIVGVIPWVIVYLLGYFVGWLGFIIGIAARKGYELLGGRPGRAKPWIILVIVILSVLVGQFAAEIISLNNVLAEEGYSGFSIFELPPLIIEGIMNDPDYQRAMLGDVGLGILFAFLGIYGLFRDLAQEGKGNISSIKKLD